MRGAKKRGNRVKREMQRPGLEGRREGRDLWKRRKGKTNKEVRDTRWKEQKQRRWDVKVI